MNRNWRKIFIACGALLALFVVFTLEENLRGRWQLSHWETEMRAKGEKFTVEELIPPRPKPEDNGGPALALAGWRLGKPTNPPIPMEYVAAGKARVVSQENGWLDEETKTNQSWASFIDVLKSKQPDITLVQQTVLGKRALDFGTHYNDFVNDYQIYFKPTYYAAQWLAAAALADVRASNLPKACEKIRAIDTLARKWTVERILRVQSAGARSIVMSNYRIIWEILQSSAVTEAQLMELQATVHEAWLLNNLPDTYAMERLQFSATLTDPNYDEETIKFFSQGNHDLFPLSYASNDHYLIKYAEDKANSIFSVFQTLGVRIYVAYWRIAWMRQAELKLLQYHQLSIVEARSMEQLRSFKDAKQIIVIQKHEREPRNWYNTARLMPVLVAMYNPEKGITLAAVSETQREMCRAAIALKRHQLKHGHYPPDLKSLVPEFLKSVPVSYMDGKPLHYRLNGDGTYLLYSASEDGKDHGGDSANRFANGTYSFQDGLDLVCPQPAAPKEIEEFEKKSKR